MPSPRTNLGPLTTQWKYPDRCTAAVIGCSTCDGAWQAQTCGDNDANTLSIRKHFGGRSNEILQQGVLDDTDCWPPRKSSMKAGNAVLGWGFYSPAFDCPQGYEPACSAYGPETGNFNFQFSRQDDENVIGCCPSGYECAGPGGRQTCTSVASIGSLQVASCSTSETVLNWLTLPATFTEETSTVTLEGVTIYAPMFQLNWREKDLPLSTTLSSESGNTRSTAPSAATYTAASESSKKSSSSGGLSTGAQAGIGAGVAVVGLAIIAAALFLWRRRRARGPTTAELATNEPKPPGQMAGTPVSPPPQYHPAELDASHHRHEI